MQYGAERRWEVMRRQVKKKNKAMRLSKSETGHYLNSSYETKKKFIKFSSTFLLGSPTLNRKGSSPNPLTLTDGVLQQHKNP